ncbi:unnamed protein product [Cladocopium goreaui]|uniref:Uncharacterized protein n=1 Tax=Cladocopium goreaui TaxID=2562237 RepID=A0A9P1C4D4_9DINO|nr:unnamed protein product [Cladocopium goreaui]
MPPATSVWRRSGSTAPPWLGGGPGMVVALRMYELPISRLPKPPSDSFVKIAMKWFTPLLVMSLISLTQSLRKEDTENDHLSPDGGDGRVSYYCASIKPQDAGSCNYIKDPDMCAERKEICIWKPYP